MFFCVCTCVIVYSVHVYVENTENTQAYMLVYSLRMCDCAFSRYMRLCILYVHAIVYSLHGIVYQYLANIQTVIWVMLATLSPPGYWWCLRHHRQTVPASHCSKQNRSKNKRGWKSKEKYHKLSLWCNCNNHFIITGVCNLEGMLKQASQWKWGQCNRCN